MGKKFWQDFKQYTGTLDGSAKLLVGNPKSSDTEYANLSQIRQYGSQINLYQSVEPKLANYILAGSIQSGTFGYLTWNDAAEKLGIYMGSKVKNYNIVPGTTPITYIGISVTGSGNIQLMSNTDFGSNISPFIKGSKITGFNYETTGISSFYLGSGTTAGSPKYYPVSSLLSSVNSYIKGELISGYKEADYLIDKIDFLLGGSTITGNAKYFSKKGIFTTSGATHIGVSGGILSREIATGEPTWMSKEALGSILSNYINIKGSQITGYTSFTGNLNNPINIAINDSINNNLSIVPLDNIFTGFPDTLPFYYISGVYMKAGPNRPSFVSTSKFTEYLSYNLKGFKTGSNLTTGVHIAYTSGVNGSIQLMTLEDLKSLLDI